MNSEQNETPESVSDESSAAEVTNEAANESAASETSPADEAAEIPNSPEKTDSGDAEPSTETDFVEALKEVIDPELMINIVDLGLIYSIAQDDDNPRKVNVDMTLTSPACPAGPQLVQQSKMALERLHDIDEAAITMVMSPPWSPERMTDDARDQLGIF
ncbi:MAG: iron-sulfur cluster assembly protein [Planctomycetaceae bacterium]|nr:iron-sulfur cluster assembly protein [Planctomycetaceae bacterium]